MNPARRVLVGAAVLIAVIAGGTLGYVFIESAAPLDALYMTVITVSTIGFTEIIPLSDAGRVFTMGLIFVGVGTALFTATAALEVGVDNLIWRRHRYKAVRAIAKTHDHFIVCGYGRVGRGVVTHLDSAANPIVVIENDPDTVRLAREDGRLVVEGDATTNRVLEEAGLARAQALIACVEGDSENLVIVLSAKALRPDIWVIARANDDESQDKLAMAGADRIVAPQQVGARRMAAMAGGGGLADFFDLVVESGLVELEVRRFDIADHSPLAGLSIREAEIRRDSGALVLAIENEAGTLSLNPDPDLRITAGHALFGVGTQAQLSRLAAMAGT